MSSFLFSSYLLHFNCKFVTYKRGANLHPSLVHGLFNGWVTLTDNVLLATSLVAKYGQRTVRSALTPALA